MKECIAAGTVVLDENKTISAAVYAEVTAGSDESGASTDGKKFVTLKYKNYACDEDVATPFGFQEITGGEEIKVPGLNGKEDVVLSEPVIVKYSKTKSFEHKGKVVVYASLRYEM